MKENGIASTWLVTIFQTMEWSSKWPREGMEIKRQMSLSTGSAGCTRIGNVRHSECSSAHYWRISAITKWSIQREMPGPDTGERRDGDREASKVTK